MLTEKQKMFCREYLVDFNATQAAIRSGYSEKTAYSIGHENLSKPDLQSFLQQLMDKRAEKVEITAEYVLNNIKTIGERCMNAEEVLVRGVPSGEYSFDASNALKAQELLGKHLVLFDKGAQNGDGANASVVVNIDINSILKSLAAPEKDVLPTAIDFAMMEGEFETIGDRTHG